ncbi:hypothetical protein BDA99DRAFT_529150 [Phascolomyces articulosus]|uniref:FBD domain-containing protein n=1 Tax=Phascolomyces articulosus TaxID=60185 RepID=A0AAD5JWN7_9FUNG|nr:hypothetical protein BDA99DRAFT_529150 [Phascolomyces articulosus]
MEQILIRLFSACPFLQAIELEEAPNNGDHFLQVNGAVVTTIAKNCPQLRHLRVTAPQNIWGMDGDYSCKSFLSFVNKHGDYGGNIYVKWWIKNTGVNQNNNKSDNLLKLIKGTLEERGGSLFVD